MNENIAIFCKSILPSGSAFGIRMDTGDDVFIPAALTESIYLREGEIVDAILVPNKHRGSTTQYLAVRIARRADEPEPEPLPEPEPEPVLTIDDRALIALRTADGYLTTGEMAEVLKADSRFAHNSLLRLFNTGKIAKADVYASSGQARPSFCLWASSAAVFTGGDDE